MNRAAAEHLIREFCGRLMRVARRNSSLAEDAEDAFARTLELALRSCPIEDDMSQVEAWASVVCAREAWKINRRYRRKPADSLDRLLDSPRGSPRQRDHLPLCDPNDALPEERVCDAETLREVYAAIEHLTPNQRCAIDGYANGWSTQEIADALGFSHRGVRKMLERGKRNLRKRLCVKEERR